MQNAHDKAPMNWGPTDFKSAALKHEPWWNGGAGSKKKEENEDLPSTKPSHIYLNGSFLLFCCKHQEGEEGRFR